MEKLTNLDELFAKMGEYIKMENELPFDEFSAFYNDLMAFLQKDYQDLTQEDLIKCSGITAIVANNSQMRAMAKDTNRKKFTKMGEKAAFWEKAIALRLEKEGLSVDEQKEQVGKLWE